MRGTTPNHRYTSDEEGVSTDTAPLRSCFVRGGVAEEVEVTEVVVTPMRLSPPEGGERKRIDFLGRSKSLNLDARRVILMMWLTPLGSGPTVSLITMNTMRIPTSCL